MDKQKAREILLEMAFAERTEFAEDRLFAFGYSEEHEALQIGIECIGKVIEDEQEKAD